MLITKTNNWDRGIRKRTIGSEIKLGPVSLKFVTIAIIAMSFLFYLAQSTHAAAQKYQIMQLNGTKLELETRGKDLEVQAARLRSLNEIKKDATSLGFETNP